MRAVADRATLWDGSSNRDREERTSSGGLPLKHGAGSAVPSAMWQTGIAGGEAQRLRSEDSNAAGDGATAERHAQSWRAGPPPRSRLGQRIFALGGSRRRAALHGVVALAATAVAVGLFRQGGRALTLAPLALALVALLAARRQLRGFVVVWSEALELRSGSRSRFEPWANARAWRRSQEFGEFDLLIRFARTRDARPVGVTLSCETHAQREAAIACLLAVDVPPDPWLDDPRKA